MRRLEMRPAFALLALATACGSSNTTPDGGASSGASSGSSASTGSPGTSGSSGNAGTSGGSGDPSGSSGSVSSSGSGASSGNSSGGGAGSSAGASGGSGGSGGSGSSGGSGALADAATSGGSGNAIGDAATSGASGSPADAASPGDAASSGAIDGSTSPGNTIAGSTTVPGASYPSIATALWLAHPDDPTSIVVYLFTKPVDCNNISMVRWDEIVGKVPNATSYLELKMRWPGATQPTAPPTLTFQVSQPVPTASSNPPPAGQTWDFAGLTAQPNPGPEVISIANGGTVTITSLTPNVNVTGTFDIKFGSYGLGTGMLNGTFDAKWCAVGREP